MRVLLCSSLLLLGHAARSQTYTIGTPLVASCSGQLFDSGGATGSYSNDESLTTVICPDGPGMQVTLTFTTFQLSSATPIQGPADRLVIHDGPEQSSPILGTYYLSSLAGITVRPSGANSSGCLRLRFVSNENGVGNFAATIACEPLCLPPTAAFIGMGDTLLACPGDVLALDAGSTDVPGGVAAWSWTVNGSAVDGSGSWPLDTLYFAEGGLYRVDLRVTNTTGCTSPPTEAMLVVVSNAATFVGTTGPAASCVGDTIAFSAAATLPPLVVTDQPGGDHGAGALLPDDVGPALAFHTTIDHYPAGATVNSTANLGDICLTMEHSHVGDLTLELICPNGQALTLHRMGTGVTMVGDAQPTINGVDAPGTCWTYCFNSTPEFGTWIEHRVDGPDPNVIQATYGTALLPGTYTPYEPLEALVGCPVNGTWTLQVIDYWAGDNGYLCSWSLGFDPFVDSAWQHVAPQLGMAHPDSAAWSGPAVWTGAIPAEAWAVQGAALGQPYNFAVLDSYGCSHDTTVFVDALPQPVVDAGPDVFLCSGQAQLNGSVQWPLGDSCQYRLELRSSNGGGWTGASLQVRVDGQLLGTYTVPFPGWSTVVPFTVANEAVVRLTYSPANATWNPFNSFVLYDAEEQAVYTSPQGPPLGVLFDAPVACTGPGVAQGAVWTPEAGLYDPTSLSTGLMVAADTWYVLSATNQGQCTARDTVHVNVGYGIAELAYEAQEDRLCAAATGAIGHAWYLNGVLVQSSEGPCIDAPAFGAWQVFAQVTDGCDRVSDVLFHCPVVEIVQDGTSLSTWPGADQYIWTLNGDTISAGPSASITVQGIGTYGVQLSTVTGCTVSAELEVGWTGIDGAETGAVARVVPNPNNGSFELRVPMHTGMAHVQVMDAQGRMVVQGAGMVAGGRLSMAHLGLNAGAYVVEVVLGTERWRVPMLVEPGLPR